VRILANENVAGHTVEALRRRGHDVAWIRTEAPGASDQQVLGRASEEGRTLLTFDKDFGELAFRAQLGPAGGVILLRLRGSAPDVVTRLIVEALDGRDDWPGHFSVIEADRIRMAPLSPTA
jgi:predicted nuclease of predicted toxin-antitoxin system